MQIRVHKRFNPGSAASTALRISLSHRRDACATKKTLSVYKGAKDHDCARTRVSDSRKSLPQRRIKIFTFPDFPDFRATFARADAQLTQNKRTCPAL